MAIFGEPSFEEAMDLSQDRLLLNLRKKKICAIQLLSYLQEMLVWLFSTSA
jgi:hypothetical protein